MLHCIDFTVLPFLYVTCYWSDTYSVIALCVHIHVSWYFDYLHVCITGGDETPPIFGIDSTPRSRVAKKNERGETPLHIASIKGDVKTATSLINQGAGVNEVDNAGEFIIQETFFFFLYYMYLLVDLDSSLWLLYSPIVIITLTCTLHVYCIVCSNVGATQFRRPLRLAWFFFFFSSVNVFRWRLFELKWVLPRAVLSIELSYICTELMLKFSFDLKNVRPY